VVRRAGPANRGPRRSRSGRAQDAGRRRILRPRRAGQDPLHVIESYARSRCWPKSPYTVKMAALSCVRKRRSCTQS
jgi:hypothetical protein